MRAMLDPIGIVGWQAIFLRLSNTCAEIFRHSPLIAKYM